MTYYQCFGTNGGYVESPVRAGAGQPPYSAGPYANHPDRRTMQQVQRKNTRAHKFTAPAGEPLRSCIRCARTVQEVLQWLRLEVRDQEVVWRSSSVSNYSPMVHPSIRSLQPRNHTGAEVHTKDILNQPIYSSFTYSTFLVFFSSLLDFCLFAWLRRSSEDGRLEEVREDVSDSPCSID